MQFISFISKRFNRPVQRLLGLAVLVAGMFGAGFPAGEAQAAPPSTNYYQISVATKVGSPIGAADDSASNGSACTLRDALGIASALTTSGPVNGCNIVKVGAGGPYVIRLPKKAYTYTLNGSDIAISSTDVYIVGSKASSSIIQASTCDPVTLPNSCTPANNRIFSINLATINTVTMENLTLRYGRCQSGCPYSSTDGAAFYQSGGTVTLRGVVATHNTADDGGGGGAGGMTYINNGSLIVTGKSLLSGNEAGYGGGAIYGGNAALIQIDGSTLLDNQGGFGGGVAIESGAAQVQIIHGSTIARSKGSTTLSAAHYGGGIYIYAGSAVLDGSTLTNLEAGQWGGAVYVGTGGKFTAQAKSVISGNKAVTGGGIFGDQASGSTVVLDASTLKGNIATSAGGGAYANGNNSYFTARNGAVISGNTSHAGGGLYMEISAHVLITGKSKVIQNTTDTDGSGAGIDSVGALVRIDGGSLISGNVAPGTSLGGGLLGDGFDLDGITISKNTAGYGGGINGSFTAHNVVITGNTATLSGGGFWVFSTTNTLDSSTLSGNVALAGDGGGGGSNNTLIVTNSTISGNKAALGRGGGLIVLNGGTDHISNSTVSANSAQNGGGLYVVNGGALNLYNATVTRNTATTAGGGVGAQSSGTLAKYWDSIISGNTAPAGIDCDNTGAGSSQGYNLVGATCDAAGAGDQSGTAALLGPLTKNGGPTLTHALLAGSPASDAGNPGGCQGDTGSGLAALSTDQRGYLRSSGAACDIGAYEAQPAPPSLTLPKAGAVVSSLKFAWKPSPGATGQELDMDSGSCTTPLGSSLSGTAKTYTPPSPLPAFGNYFWCVRTTAAGPVALGEVRAFEYTFALKPANNGYAKQGNVKFSWKKLTDPSNGQPATGYDLIVSSSSTCPSGDVASQAGITAASATAFVSPGARYWQITVHFPASPDAASTCRALNVTY